MGQSPNDAEAVEILTAEAAAWVEEHDYDLNWPTTAARFGLSNLVRDNERLTRAQGFRDPDYVDAVRRFFLEAYERSPAVMHRFLLHVVGEPDENLRQTYPTLAAYLDAVPSESVQAVIPPALPASVKYLQVQTLPNDFYDDLVGQINRCYQVALFPAQLVLLRKLMENLVIDILRRKYGTSDIGLYFDAARGRLKEFAVVLDNLDGKLTDFKSTSPGLDKDAIQKLQRFRESGNRTAHTIEAHVTKSDVDDLRDDATYLVKLLSTAYDKMLPAP